MTESPRRAARWAAVLLLLAACGPAEKDRVALVGATVITGAGDAPVADAVVIIYQGKIETIAPRDGFEIPKSAEIIDITGQWVIPGLIDGHVHVARWALDRYVAAGVTSVRDVYGLKDSVLALHEETSLGGLVAPRVYTAGALIDGPGTTEPGATEVHNASEARRAVDDRAVAGVNFLTVGPLMTADLLKAVLDEAVTFELKVTAHLGLIDARAAASSGLAAVEYLSGVPEAASGKLAPFAAAHRLGPLRGWTEFEKGWSGLDSAGVAGVALALAQAKVTLVPTLVLHEVWSRLDDPAMLSDPDLGTIPRTELENWNVPGLVASAGWGTDDFTAFRASRPRQDQFIREFRAAGGRLVAGTHSARPMLIPGLSLHTEMELLVNAGLSTSDAILAATHNAAQLLGADSIGMIAPGKVADLVVLSADPLADIRNTRRVVRVMLRGQLFSVDSLRKTW